MTEATQRTSDSGVSIWLDDLSRTRIESGNLQELIKDKNVVGVTTNPSIFQKALSQVGPYDAQLKELGKVDVETAIRELTTTDVRNATDIFREIAELPTSSTAASPSRSTRVWPTTPRTPPSRLWNSGRRSTVRTP